LSDEQAENQHNNRFTNDDGGPDVTARYTMQQCEEEKIGDRVNDAKNASQSSIS